MSERVLRPVRRERRDIGIRFMLMLLAGIGACLLLTLAVAYWIYPHAVRDDRFGLPFPKYPAPMLQPSPPVDMDVFYRQEMAELTSAGWIDRKAGIVHIPIEQAMQAIAREGITGWPTTAKASLGARR